jgi:predicted Zn-dependent protease
MRLNAAQAVEVALEHARVIPGVIDLVAVSSHDSSASLRWANNTLTTNGYGWFNHLTVVAYVALGGGVAISSLSENDPAFDAGFVRGLVDKTIRSARTAVPAHHGLLVTPGVYGDWDAAAVSTDLDVLGLITPELGEALKRGTVNGRNHSGYAEHVRESSWTGSLSGLRLREDSQDGRIEMTSRAERGLRSAWVGLHSRTFTDIDVSALDVALEQQLKWQLIRKELPAGRYRTILGPGPVGDLLSTFDSNLIGRDAIEGSGPFARAGGQTLLGERIAGRKVFDLFSDPAYPGIEGSPYVVDTDNGPTSSVFDIGQRFGRIDWVRDGVLNALCTTREVASRSGLAYNPDGTNLILSVDGGRGTLDEVIARTEHGLLVNCLWYIRDLDEATMTVTGTTRDGVYEVRDGEVVAAVNNFRFNESPLSILGRIHDAGSPEICQTRENAEMSLDYAMPTLVVDDFTMSSVSEAS